MAVHHEYTINTCADDQESLDSDSAPLLDTEVKDVAVPPRCCSVRCNLALMMFLGFAVVYGLRVNLSVAMVAMVNGTNNQSSSDSNLSSECPVPSNTHDNQSQSSEQPEGVCILTDVKKVCYTLKNT
ncbi:hypothetical protein DNTS_032507 [Danionella cerebrum]|uniref:Uncharacterized protein n=1 Tax=Danionella cerebrum TaxID=2873325 RepID=A0A553PZX2_9TELE|nr:hypothetical protein DNTS_032507 [Danionella translucida]